MRSIVVLDRGWVVVGTLEDKGEEYVLHDGAVVRRWGTNMGIGQLAMEGIRDETKLDPLPITLFYKRTVIMKIECNEEKWKENMSYYVEKLNK